MDDSTEKIYVLGIDEDESVESRSIFKKKSSEIRYGRGEVSVNELNAQLKSFLGKMQGVVDETPAKLGSYRVDSVTMSLEVSAKGTVSLLGTGGEVGGTAGLTFTLKRDPSS